MFLFFYLTNVSRPSLFGWSILLWLALACTLNWNPFLNPAWILFTCRYFLPRAIFIFIYFCLFFLSFASSVHNSDLYVHDLWGWFITFGCDIFTFKIGGWYQLTKANLVIVEIVAQYRERLVHMSPVLLLFLWLPGTWLAFNKCVGKGMPGTLGFWFSRCGSWTHSTTITENYQTFNIYFCVNFTHEYSVLRSNPPFPNSMPPSSPPHFPSNFTSSTFFCFIMHWVQ